MALIHGKSTVIKFGSSDLSTYTKSSEFVRKADTEDVTTYGKNDHVYAGGLGDATFKCEGMYDSTASTGPRAVIEPMVGTEVVLTRQPEGTGSGKPQDVVDMIITSYTESSPVAGYVTWAVEAQCSDSVNSTAQAS